MRELIEKTSIGPAVLKKYMQEACDEGCRLVQIHANRMEGRFEIIYSLALEYRLIQLYMVVLEDTEVESISDIYPAAQLYEQEMAELFGVKMKNIAADPHVKLYHVKGHPMK
jgi:ech hydrogenase subunit D